MTYRTSLPLHSTEDGKPKKKAVKKTVKAAKKLIRKGKNQKGMATVRAKVQDEVGHRTGYSSEATKRLYASRLVQRKFKQERKDLAKAQISKGAHKEWVGKPKYDKPSETYTKKTAKETVKKIRKSYKADAKKTTKASKARAKVTRKSYR